MPTVFESFNVTFRLVKALIAYTLHKVMATLTKADLIKTTGVIVVSIDVMS